MAQLFSLGCIRVFMIRKLKTTAKFVIILFVMTIVCSIGWAFVAGELYDCTDPGFIDFLSPGDWVHGWPGHPVATVEKIVHGRSMSEPDTIRHGWTVAGLWCLWFLFVGVSFVISFFLSRKTWLSSSTMQPNQSPEPTAVGAGRSAVAVHAASRRWLSFFR